MYLFHDSFFHLKIALNRENKSNKPIYSAMLTYSLFEPPFGSEYNAVGSRPQGRRSLGRVVPNLAEDESLRQVGHTGGGGCGVSLLLGAISVDTARSSL